MSSTLEELAPERVAAREAIEQMRLVPVMFELGARPHPPRTSTGRTSTRATCSSVCTGSGTAGSRPTMDVSGLEDEWLMSTHHPRLIYLKHSDEPREPRLDALIERIRDGGVSYRSFGDADELRDLLENDLAVLLSERFETGSTPVVDLRAQSVVPETKRLPIAPSSIIGREDELRELRLMFERDDTRLVSVTGAGGSGKTRLVLELATTLRDELGWPVAWVDLTGLRTASVVLPTIASGLGVKDAADGELVDAIATVMASRQMLLVIDNFEHVLEAAPVLADILAVTSDVKMLVTSRQALHLRWEQEFPLAPLAVPDPEQQHSAEAISASPSVELLLDRIHRVRPQFVLDDTNAQDLAEIARRLDGLPLALELAAARLRVLGPADLLARLEHTLDSIAGSAPDMPGRHRTLRATISWSHDQLNPAEQAVFRRLGVFAGGAGLDAIEAVCCGVGVDVIEVLDLLGSLVDKSLVRATRRVPARTGHRRDPVHPPRDHPRVRSRAARGRPARPRRRGTATWRGTPRSPRPRGPASGAPTWRCGSRPSRRNGTTCERRSTTRRTPVTRSSVCASALRSGRSGTCAASTGKGSGACASYSN